MAYIETDANVVGTSEALGETPVGSIAQTLSPITQSISGEVHTIGTIGQALERQAYTTTGKYIQGEFASYQSYDKSQMWAGDNGSEFTFAAFMRWPHAPANDWPTIFRDAYINIQGYAWYDSGTLNQIVVNLNADGPDYDSPSLGVDVHGIKVGDWFALMISIDYSGATPIYNVWVQKKGENNATNIFTTPWAADTGPGTFLFDNTDSITAFCSHPWVEASSSDLELSEVIITNEYVDWSDSAERAKFVDDAGRPIGLGADGSGLTGTAAKIYLPTGDGTDNKGTAGNFTAVGTIIDSSTSPSEGAISGMWLSQSLSGRYWDKGGPIAQTLPILEQIVTGAHWENGGSIAQTTSIITQTLAGTFVPGFRGEIVQTLPTIIQVGTATYGPGIQTGTGAQTLQFLTLHITAKYWPSWRWGSTEQTLPFLSQAGTATYGPGIQTGGIIQTMNDIVQAMSGTFLGIRYATIDQTLPSITQAGAATYGPGTQVGQVAQSLPLITQIGNAHYEPGSSSGYSNLTLFPITQALTGALAHAGTIDQTLPSITQAVTATYDSGTFAATGAQTVPFVTQTLVGKMVRTSTGAQTLPFLSQSLDGLYGPGISSGEIDSTLSTITQTGTATYGPGIQAGVIDQTTPFITQQVGIAVTYVVIPAIPLVWEQPGKELVWEQEWDELLWES